MTSHYLKTWPEYFSAILSGAKTFELRPNDRQFAVGDVLVLREWEPSEQSYTGRTCRRRVTYIWSGYMAEIPGVLPGYVVMGLTGSARESALEREDRIDSEIADARLREIDEDPSSLVSGDELPDELTH